MASILVGVDGSERSESIRIIIFRQFYLSRVKVFLGLFFAHFVLHGVGLLDNHFRQGDGLGSLGIHLIAQHCLESLADWSFLYGCQEIGPLSIDKVFVSAGVHSCYILE